MTVYVKPTVRQAWAETATGTDIQDPGNTFAAAGWPIGQKPPRQYMNWVLNYCFEGIRYLCQSGVVDWDVAETYPVGSVARGPDGILYRSIAANNVGHTPSSSPTQWGSPWVVTPANGSNDNSVATTAWAKTNLLAAGAPFSALSGSINNGQVPLSAVTQWQGSLAINFSQLVGVASGAQIPQTAVTQYQADLTILWAQISGTKNADQLLGLVPGPAGSYSGGTLARYDSTGVLYSHYLNQDSANNENPTINQVLVTNGTDNFLRKSSMAALFAALVTSQSKNTNGFVKLPGGIILQWGQVSYPGSGGASATFPTPFATGCFNAQVSPQVGGNCPGISNVTPTGITFNTNNMGGTAQAFWWFAVGV